MRHLAVVALSCLLLAGSIIVGLCSPVARAEPEVSGFVSSNGGCMGMVAIDGGETIDTAVVGETAASDVGADADVALEPPEVEEGFCDVDAGGVLWCKQNGVLLANCAELADGTVECPEAGQ